MNRTLLLLLGLSLLPFTLVAQTNTEPYTILTCQEKANCPATVPMTVAEDHSNFMALRNFFTQSEADYHMFLPGASGALPTNCEPGQIWTDRDAAATAFLNVCTATDTWTAFGSGGSFTSFDVDYGAETVTSTWTMQNLFNMDSGTEGIIRLPASASTPGTCTTGEIYFDSDATAGLNLYGCTATNTWTLLGDGGGAGSPGGSDTEFQYNNSSAFGGITEMTYNDGTGAIAYTDATEGNFSIEATQTATNLSLETLVLKNTTTAASGGLGIEQIFQGVDSDNDEQIARITAESASSALRSGEIWFDTIDSGGLWQDWKPLGVDGTGSAFTGKDLDVGTDGVEGANSILTFYGDLRSNAQTMCFDGGNASALVLNNASVCSTATHQLEVKADSAANDGLIARLWEEGGNGTIDIETDGDGDIYIDGSDSGNTPRYSIIAAEDKFSFFHSPIRFQPTDTPPTCDGTNKGALYYDTSEDRFKKCDGTVAWVNLEGGAFSPSTLDVDYGAETVTNDWEFQGALTFDGATEGTIRLPASASLPGTCTIGDQYWDTDQDTDGAFYVCKATNTWKIQGGGSGGSPGGSTGDVQVNDGASGFLGDPGFNWNVTTEGLTLTNPDASSANVNLVVDAETGGTSSANHNAMRIQVRTTDATVSDGYGPQLLFAAEDSGGINAHFELSSGRSGGDTSGYFQVETYTAGSPTAAFKIMPANESYFASWLGVGSLTPASATCMDADTDRVYGDKDCDGTKDAGEEYFDAAAAGSMPDQVINIPGTALLPIEHGADSYYTSGKITGTNADIWTADFGASADQCGGFSFAVTDDVDTSGSVEFKAIYTATVAATAEVVWEVREKAVGDSESWDQALTGHSSSAANCAGPSPAKDVENCAWSVTVSTLTWVADDWVQLEFCRDPDHADDTNAQTMRLLQLVITIPRA